MLGTIAGFIAGVIAVVVVFGYFAMPIIWWTKRPRAVASRVRVKFSSQPLPAITFTVCPEAGPSIVPLPLMVQE